MARPLKNLCEVTVIGGGLAGLAAARQAARLGRLVTLFEGSGIYGGQVGTVDHVDGLPFPGSHSGQDLAMHLLEEARKAGVRMIEAQVDALHPGDSLRLVDSEGGDHHPEVVIVASGTSPRKLGVPGEEQFAGRGVSRCASCDGGFYVGKDVVVIGGGDAAVHEALVLARSSRMVTMICRSPLKAQREYIDRLDARENVRFVWNAEVIAIEGGMKVEGVRLRDRDRGGETIIEAAGVFPFIGGEPATAFLPEAMRLGSGHADHAADPRVIVVGAVRAGYGGLAVQAMAEGALAAQKAHRILAGKN